MPMRRGTDLRPGGVLSVPCVVDASSDANSDANSQPKPGARPGLSLWVGRLLRRR